LPPSGIPAAPLTQEELDRAVEELSELLDRNMVPQRLLDELGTDRQQLRSFVERYRERRRQEGSVEPAQGATADAGARVVPGGRAAEGVAEPGVLSEKVRRDALRSRFEGSLDRLSPRYRELVRRYYEALSEQ